MNQELLREECKISKFHRGKGFIRGPKAVSDAYSIDKIACDSLSRIICNNNWNLEETTRFLHGEGISDSRPNKALDSGPLRMITELTLSGERDQNLQGHLLKTMDRVVGIYMLLQNHFVPVRIYSFVPRLDQEYVHDQVTSEKHKGKTPSVFLTAGQRLAVEKKDIHPSVGVRLIHDLSFPKNDSVNAAFVIGSVPKVRYESVVIIAQRIEYLAQKGFTGRVRMLKGDVKSAFRHLMTIASQTFRMAAFVPELSVLAIDMAAPFGWAGSPPYYSLFGRAISWLMGNSSPSSVSNSMDTDPFFPYEWVDDHILVEPDVGNRLQLAAATLRHAMLAVLGYRSINESKFSTWSSEIVALGLLWNTERRTVSIPRAKIAKARGRVSNMIKPGSATKTEFYKVLGSLRHVTNCLRTAKPFYQQLQAQCNSAPRFGKVMLSSGASADLEWFQLILDHGCPAELPLRMFGDLPEPDVALYMDASNTGLAILDPAWDSYTQLKFDLDELVLIDEANWNK
ncbi:hypothetical protein PHMEG_00025201 [Phytophthora megakarya]|uniref:Reverse transcriptase n=1 Tax=Phytophthora megakarya TaxID=4795 RepID=A0A225VBP4_9STRA|nr:hypothetical protein PHMEG_00025201 [Phytophthora megakarya]